MLKLTIRRLEENHAFKNTYSSCSQCDIFPIFEIYKYYIINLQLLK